MYFLTLVFACQVGCSPAHVELHQPYRTMEACQAAGNLWISPNANPQGAVSHFTCDQHGHGNRGEHGKAGDR